ncbi:MAG: preprotein translocase subunit SecA [Clostridia bacterium]|nr:preprotein translocase subunit SecA [Clostridia bacterium]
MGFFDKIFGTYSQKELKRMNPIIDKVEALDSKFSQMSQTELRGMTEKLKARLQAGETTDDILPEAFAAVREAAWRVLGLKHYRVQLIGGLALYQGRIAEMKTGEGKTLVATLPAYLMALTGEGVHIVTVNDYLAKRDSEWMGKIYRYLGLTVGLVVNGLDHAAKQAAYAADITYGTNNEFGFDYLRDNMVTRKEAMVQRGHAFAIVDEVDSILIDEARTPLIISGQGGDSTEIYEKVNRFVRGLRPMRIVELDDKESYDDVDADYIVDEKAKNATLTPRGVKKAEQAFGVDNLMDPEHMRLLHHINQAIHAYGVKVKDIDYVVKDGEVLIVDEFTGRIMIGRRYSEGLHQAIEAKENVPIKKDSRTLASITFQNYFRLYKKLSGMTGTALTEEEEFREIYKLDVVEIPTNKPMIRKDNPDVIYRTEAGKFKAVVEKIKECHAKGQPILVGTITIEKSELLSKLLKKSGIPHEVLNAKNHEKEAYIVAQAGKPGAVTIATNMAGRGTDIMLGGNAEFMSKREMEKEGFDERLIFEATEFSETDDEDILRSRRRYAELLQKNKALIAPDAEKVREAGGLYILGTERHDSRRIDNQLRGRAGRQGDPGESSFLISLEDDIARLFAGEKLKPIMATLGFNDDEPIEHKMVSGIIENAQKNVESQNFGYRKNVIKFDDVLNQQREIIYSQRRQVLNGENMRPIILKMIEDTINDDVMLYANSEIPDEWNIKGLKTQFEGLFLTRDDLNYTTEDFDRLTQDDLRDFLQTRALEVYEAKEKRIGEDIMRQLERLVLLQNVDNKWMDHIDMMDHLRQTVNLRAYAQKDPLVEYKFEGANMFDEMIQSIKADTVRYVFLVEVRERKPAPNRPAMPQNLRTNRDGGGAENAGAGKPKPVKVGVKVGRNDPCPCGSGKKYKKCCGA